jgi:hypothetical protein
MHSSSLPESTRRLQAFAYKKGTFSMLYGINTFLRYHLSVRTGKDEKFTESVLLVEFKSSN